MVKLPNDERLVVVALGKYLLTSFWCQIWSIIRPFLIFMYVFSFCFPRNPQKKTIGSTQYTFLTQSLSNKLQIFLEHSVTTTFILIHLLSLRFIHEYFAAEFIIYKGKFLTFKIHFAWRLPFYLNVFWRIFDAREALLVHFLSLCPTTTKNIHEATKKGLPRRLPLNYFVCCMNAHVIRFWFMHSLWTCKGMWCVVPHARRDVTKYDEINESHLVARDHIERWAWNQMGK